jgi:4-carboxymuconolactone decarboxylase
MSDPYDAALELAGELLGRPLDLPLGPGEPESGREFRCLATLHTFGDSWSRTRRLDTRTRSLISVAIAAALGTHEPLRGQLRIALNNGATKDEIIELLSASRHTTAPHGRSTPTKSPPPCSQSRHDRPAAHRMGPPEAVVAIPMAHRQGTGASQ